MSSIIYREEQAVRESFIPFIFIPVWLVLVGVFTWGFYEQLVLGKPWGDDPMSNSALLVTGITTILVTGVFFMLMLNGKLILEVRSDGFSYAFIPFNRKMKHIPRKDIASADIRKFGIYSRMNRRGVHHNLFSRTTSYSLGGGSTGMQLITARGKRLIFSVKRIDEMQKALNTMMSQTT